MRTQRFEFIDEVTDISQEVFDDLLKLPPHDESRFTITRTGGAIRQVLKKYMNTDRIRP